MHSLRLQLLLVLFLSLGLAGCGGSSDDPPALSDCVVGTSEIGNCNI